MIISHEKPIRRPAVVWQSWGEKIGVKHRISPANSILRNVERDVERFVHGPAVHYGARISNCRTGQVEHLTGGFEMAARPRKKICSMLLLTLTGILLFPGVECRQSLGSPTVFDIEQ